MLNKRCYPKMTIGIIPTSYLDSLTFLEQVMCINQKLCEIINYLDNFNMEEIENLINQKITEVQEYVDNQDKILYNYIDEQGIKLKDYVDTNLNIQVNILKELISQKVEFLLNYINNSNEILKLQFEQEINELKEEIQDIIINGINLYDPTTGQMNNVQDVVFNIYKYLRYYGIKAIDFDKQGFTCAEFENKNLTAREFDLYSKCKLTIDFLHNMFSPFNGEITSISSLVNQLASLHKNEITAQEFDNLELTAQAFDDKDLTAYDFDWNAKILLTA